MVRIGILRGGPSHEYDASLKTGSYVLSQLPKDGYELIDIYVDREGVWHIDGVPASADRLRHRVDVVWNALHGHYGEDGKVHQFLSAHGIPYVGPDPVTASVVMNRKLLSDRLATLSIPTPDGIHILEWGNEEVDDVVSHIARKLSPPWRVGSLSRGHEVQSIRCMSRPELYQCLLERKEQEIPVSVEQEVFGTRAHVVTLRKFRNQDYYVCVPSGVSDVHVKKELERIARKIHKEVDLGHYAIIEAVVTARGKVYVTKVRTQPYLHEGSEFEKALHHLGASFKEVAESIIRAVRGMY